jgi:hypothetical protein
VFSRLRLGRAPRGGEELDDACDRARGQRARLRVNRQRPRRHPCDDNSASSLDVQGLPVYADREEERRLVTVHVPLVPVADRLAGKILGEVADRTRVRISLVGDVRDPRFGNDLRAPACASLDDHLANAPDPER